MNSGAGRHYCTYFDHRYLPRGLALYESILRHDPCATLWVLSLSDECHLALESAALPGMRTIPLSLLEASDPALSAVRPTRSLVEYYFTLSPCWPLYLLRREPEIEVLTYLDADLCLFSDPTPAFREITEASVAITPHRFPQRLAHLEQFGRFNVGWLTYRRSAEAITCLQWWREQCLDWCLDTLDGERFADQKYLDSFQSLFAHVQVISHPGVNLAPWNLGTHRVESRGDSIVIDGYAPLIAYHFQGVRRIADGTYDCNLDDYGISMSPMLRDQLYLPYLRFIDARSDQVPDASSIRVSTATNARERISGLIQRNRARWKGSILHV